MFVVWKGRQLWEMRGIIISKNKNSFTVLVLIHIHVPFNNILNVDILSDVEQGTVGEEQATVQEANMRSPFIIGHRGPLYAGLRIDQGGYFMEVILDQFRRTPISASLWAFSI